MKSLTLDLGRRTINIQVPKASDVFGMSGINPLTFPQRKILSALRKPIGSPPLSRIVQDKLQKNPKAQAVVVISDDTRPVPYKGARGILYPVIDQLMESGLNPERIKILVATGTHLPMREQDLMKILDPRIFSLGIPIHQHDCRDNSSLIQVGHTERVGRILINRLYMEADIKILTGLVESHFMAGASGGRKSICPGLMAEESMAVIHGGPILHSPLAKDLTLEGNPVHEEALRIARMAGADFIVNVTLDDKYRLSDVFAGDMEQAHLRAVAKLRSYVGFKTNRDYDLVISHAGFVGVNHYQAAKAAVICASLIRPGGICVLAADHTLPEPVGSPGYRRLLRLMGEVGAEKYEEMITAPDWDFVPEQWEPQMWGRLFSRIPPADLYYCTLNIPPRNFDWIPGRDARKLAPGCEGLENLVDEAVVSAAATLRRRLGREPETAVLKDGPYAIPLS
jgi:nickel-dependent lactate racemase